MPPKWKSVPMPPAVARLPRDKRGFPVPWVSEWDTPTPEAPDGDHQYGLTEGPWGKQMNPTCSHIDGVGEPDLGNLCGPRAMRGMFDGSCDVCGDPVQPPYYFIGDGGLAYIGYRELPCHLECALYACQVCPGIVTPARNEVNIRVVECWDYERLPFWRSALGEHLGSHVNDLERIQIIQALGFPTVLMAFLGKPTGDNVRSMTIAEFLAEHGR